MAKRLRILVAGGFDPAAPGALAAPAADVEAFGRELGWAVIDQGHSLLTGCQTDLDRIVAEGATSHSTITDLKEKDEDRIVSYVLQGKDRAHSIGSIMQSERKDWDIGGLDASPPEVVRNSDVVVLLGGFYGTYQAANWARVSRIPLLPFYSFGGAAREVYSVESRRFDAAYADRVKTLEYDQVLKSVSGDWKELARDTIQLAEKIATTRSVLVCMSFAEKPEYKDLMAAIKTVCQEYEFLAERIDESNLSKRVVPQLLKQVRRAAFVVADVTEEKANVYYELGFADGAGQEVILVARKGTRLPFNVSDIPVVFWESFEYFKQDLRKRVRELGVSRGRA